MLPLSPRAGGDCAAAGGAGRAKLKGADSASLEPSRALSGHLGFGPSRAISGKPRVSARVHLSCYKPRATSLGPLSALSRRISGNLGESRAISANLGDRWNSSSRSRRRRTPRRRQPRRRRTQRRWRSFSSSCSSSSSRSRHSRPQSREVGRAVEGGGVEVGQPGSTALGLCGMVG